MKVESVDMFYLAMPEMLDIGDGSQDMVLVRVRAGGHTGWGECEAAPLPSIASFVCPMSHSACHPVRDSVLGATVNTPADIACIAARVRASSLDLLQAEHTLSGIEIALWDVLGQARDQPVWEMLGYDRSLPKTPYASALFGDTPQQTLDKAREVRQRGFMAAKFGWGPYGSGTVEADADQVHAAREGFGVEGILLVDAGTVWDQNVAAAAARLPALRDADVRWLEEPFRSGALQAYRKLADMVGGLGLAAGEGAHNALMAQQLVDVGGIGLVQVDTGRIGGIGDAKQAADYAQRAGIQFINHTFTSHLALSASLQPFAGRKEDWLCEYPAQPSALAVSATDDHLLPGVGGTIAAPDAPGLGVRPDLEAVRRYLLDVEIRIGGQTLYSTPELSE